jgi:ABC-type phosphate transport system permease subunit
MTNHTRRKRSQPSAARSQQKSDGLWRAALGYFSAAFAILMSMFAAQAPVFAQCPMCKAAAASQGPQATSALNLGILILLVPTLAIFIGAFVIAYRYRHSPAGDPAAS